MFPYIKNITDVLPYIKDDECFVVIEKDGYTVIDYVIEKNDTFPALNDLELGPSIRRECRGIAFDTETGVIVRRGLQKFFNVGQKEETLVANIDWSKSNTVMDKLDGSLIFCGVRGNDYWLGTRKGETDVSALADSFVSDKPEYDAFIRDILSENHTPFFEFFCNENMVVIDYEDPFMTVLSARNMYNGDYMCHDELSRIANKHGVSIVKTHKIDISNPSEFLEKARNEKDVEGYVVRFQDGQTVKIKGEWYVNLHHIVSGLNSNRNIVKLLINNEIDDILPMLPDRRRVSIESFANNFWIFYESFKLNIMNSWSSINNDLSKIDNPSRKDWAMRILKEDKYISGLLFKILDDSSIIDEHMKSFIYSKANKEKIFDGFIEWSGLELG